MQYPPNRLHSKLSGHSSSTFTEQSGAWGPLAGSLSLLDVFADANTGSNAELLLVLASETDTI